MSGPFVSVSRFVEMHVCGLLALAVLVLVINFGHENEVSASPVPDPCNIFLNRLRRPKTAEPPKTEEQKIEESKKKVIGQYWKILKLLSEDSWTSQVKPEPPAPKTMDMNSVFNAYIDFLTKFWNLF